VQITWLNIVGFVREPSALFWTFGFPILLTLALGVAFRSSGPPDVVVGTSDPQIAAAMKDVPGLQVRQLAPEPLAEALRHGRIALSATREGDTVVYAFDAQRPEARAAQLLTDGAVQRQAGRRDAQLTRDALVTAKGARYIDWLVPGLLGLQLMSGSLWGIGFNLVNLRVRKLLKRLAATPMRRSHFLSATILSRLVWLPWEIGALSLFAHFVFGVELHGSVLALVVVSFAGAACFAGMGLLVASRAQNTETAGGLMNLLILPMSVCSGVFFATSNFPAAVQPWLRLLPLTALNDALRAGFNDGTGLTSQGGPVLVLGVWGAVSFGLALKLFRWT
jgi:ABC-type multidrug transport system permease subunit